MVSGICIKIKKEMKEKTEQSKKANDTEYSFGYYFKQKWKLYVTLFSLFGLITLVNIIKKIFHNNLRRSSFPMIILLPLFEIRVCKLKYLVLQCYRWVFKYKPI